MDPFNSYLIQQRELYGSSFYLDNNYDEIYRIIKNCSKCKGDLNSEIIFIGEESYLKNEKENSSLLYESNHLFSKIISAISLSVKDIFTTNIVKVFYQDHNVDKIENIYDCRQHLEFKMQLVETKVIIALGQSAANFLLDNSMTIKEMRKIKLRYKNVRLFTTYSPSSLIIDENLKKPCWDDFKRIKTNYID